MYAVAVGALLLALSWQNRANDNTARQAGRLFTFAMGVLLVMASIILTEKSYPNAQRTGSFYIASTFPYAFYLTIASRVSRGRWGATSAAAIYMAIICAIIWILPLFKAQPLLAPIYLQVDRMVPPIFPCILILPALFMDLINQRLGTKRTFWSDTLCAIALGIAFLAIFLAVQWNFSAFLLSKSADNWFFAGGRQWPYFIEVREWRYRFWGQDGDNRWLNSTTLLIALACAIGKARIGLWFANWMRRVQR
jgi:hypothetical protein